ncbi:hypothetical protein HMPREF9344_01708 [Cutibacterium acnes HL097PA1]|nr:hypothetical protein HMPREF9344_01708 [Cutibacterium acnes HL097PA1]
MRKVTKRVGESHNSLFPHGPDKNRQATGSRGSAGADLLVEVLPARSTCRARAMRRGGNTGASSLRIGQFSRRGDGRGTREPGPIYVVGIFVTALSGLLEVTPSFS